MTEHNPYQVGENADSVNADLHGAGAGNYIRRMQIVTVAMLMGVLSFLLVVLVVTEGNVLELEAPPLVTQIAAGFAALMIVNQAVIPGIVASAQLKAMVSSGLPQQDAVSQHRMVTGVFQTELIIALAMLEGAAFFNLIALLISKSGFSLMAVVLLVCLMLLRFPTENKVSSWVEFKLREITELNH